jgi:asparagine synthase (glutamine-hydrolysing)
MSIIFGIRRSIGQDVDRDELLTLASATCRYASAGTFVHACDKVGMGFQPTLTHERSQLESQPATDRMGNLLVFDGRLDNHADLRSRLGITDPLTPDSDIVLAAFVNWGTQCFSSLIGDWALALWSTNNQIMYLARDHAGARTLYFRNNGGTLSWATYLETFFAHGERYSLNEQYAAAYLCARPTRALTPYAGIEAVAPAHYFAIQGSSITKTMYWNPVAQRLIFYKSDAEYEEHFLSLFRQSVERRTGPGAPILAELSGGMDSTSIVCVSDDIRRSHGIGVDKLLDTISFYDPAEPDWNEESYFTITEAKRGKRGVHIETPTATRTFESADAALFGSNPPLWPGTDRTILEQEFALASAIGDRCYKAIISGIGGDELLGGLPLALPELADCLVSGRITHLLHQSMKWCMPGRASLIQLLYETVRFTRNLYQAPQLQHDGIPPWILPGFAQKCCKFEQDNAVHQRRFGRMPSRLSFGLAWSSIYETLPHTQPGCLSRFEFRYPYLDRDLVDYLAQVPREQVVRPGRRRSLMRRALRNIVPVEILERRRKGSIIRGPLIALQRRSAKIEELFRSSCVADLGFVEPTRLKQAIDFALTGQEPRWGGSMMRVIGFELWLRGDMSMFVENFRPLDFSLQNTAASL